METISEGRFGVQIDTDQIREFALTAPSKKVRPPALGVTNFRDLTGGVYKARERITLLSVHF